MILPGLNRPTGSSLFLIARKASLIAGPNCHAIHSPRHSPSPCSPLYAPLYLRTSAAASSAIARIFAAPPVRMSRIGRTCSVPTDACAYQVPRVPCLAKVSVSASVYSARCSSGTAQSSMKLTGFPSPLRLIMMLSPALRTSHRFFWIVGSGISTTLPGSPRSPISATRSFSFASSTERSSPANSTSRIAAGLPISAASIDGRNAGLERLRSIIVRSTSSTAVGPSLTRYCGASIAARKVGKLTMPSTLSRGSSDSCNVNDLVKASVPSAPTSRCARLTLPSAVYGFSLCGSKMSRL